MRSHSTILFASPNRVAAASKTSTSTTNGVDTRIVTAAVTKIRQTVTPNKQGEYATSAVGQVLAQMGHDKTTRARIVRAIPNLKEAGSGSEKWLIF
ncbi:MAG: hypothetical protein Q7J47_21490 [Azoarcus sp.]|nr:hypothetical protein [Azoarcus sp.]